MNWWQHLLLDSGLTAAFIWSVVLAVRYRKQNAKLKDLEVEKNESEAMAKEIENQRAQIELGELFTRQAAEMFKQMQALQEETYKATVKNGTDNEGIIKRLEDVVKTQEKLANEQKRQNAELKRLSEGQSHMVSFLNGEYQSFLKSNGLAEVMEKPKRKPRKKAEPKVSTDEK